MATELLILEDDSRRREEMARVLGESQLAKPLFAATACEFVRLAQLDARAFALISLDRDLEPLSPADDEPATDPGTGRVAAEFLSERRPACPVVIHSTNHPAALAMEAILSERGWRVERVMPYGDLAWVAELWLPLVRTLLRTQRGE